MAIPRHRDPVDAIDLETQKIDLLSEMFYVTLNALGDENLDIPGRAAACLGLAIVAEQLQDRTTLIREKLGELRAIAEGGAR